MRVGVIGPNREDDFAFNILDGLRSLGIDCFSLGDTVRSLPGRPIRALARTAQGDPRIGPLLERHLVAQAKSDDIDLVVTVVSLRPETVAALARAGVRSALWFPDHVANLGPLWMFDAPYDGIFFKEPALVRRVQALTQLRIHYLPEACNPRIHRPVELDPDVSRAVVIIGNVHPIRARLLERLAGDGVPLRIYGNPQHRNLYDGLRRFHTGRYVRGLEKSRAFGEAGVVLNNLHPAEIEGMNCRLFEATTAGGAVLSEHRSELPDLFDVGSEVRSFADYRGLREQIDELLSSPAVGSALGEAASRRAHADHTYEARLHRMLELLG